MNKKTIFEEYAVIDAMIKSLTNQKDELRIKILEDLIEKGVEKIATEVGSFSVTKLKTWTYPEKVLELGEKLKVEKSKAESTGEATFVEKESLRFIEIKL